VAGRGGVAPIPVPQEDGQSMGEDDKIPSWTHRQLDQESLEFKYEEETGCVHVEV
jgi:hypothetical protein